MKAKKKEEKKVSRRPSVGLRGKKKMVPPSAGLRPKKKRLRLKIGMVVKCRDGHVTKPLAKNEFGQFSKSHPFYDRLSARSFRPGGGWGVRRSSSFDAVREVVKRRGK